MIALNKKKTLKKSNTEIIETKVKKIRIPKKTEKEISDEIEEKKKIRKSKMYFTQDTEDAIIKFNAETDDDKRNEIYRLGIERPFNKLVENIFNTFKFTYFEVGPLDAQKEVVSFLVSNIHKFQPGKGKAFSYFSIVAKHYLILQNNTNYARFKRHVDIVDQPIERKELVVEPIVNSKKEESNEFVKLMVEYWDKNINVLFTKKRDLIIAYAVVELFRRSDRIENFNKKALYLYIREIADCRTQHITKVINKMKMQQNNITKSYINKGYITKSIDR
jgi:hypothetical protein